jgi:hypothetical protein
MCSAATSTCEPPGGDLDGSVHDAAIDGFLIDGCTPSPEICGDGIDQDCNGSDVMCPVNDLAAGAIDITAGGLVTGDLSAAHDDSSRPNGGMFCGGTGGRDLYYKIHLTADEAYYIDTFGSDFDTVIRVFRGPCADGPAPGSTKCHNDNCSTAQSQGVWDLTSGDWCVVVDQNSNAETKGSLRMHVERGNRTGSPVAATNTSDTTGGSNQSTGTCAATGNDVGYYFTGCPGGSLAVTATTCNAATTWDTALYARGAAGQITCNDDDPTPCAANAAASRISFTANGAHLFWIIVDAGSTGAVGPFEVDTTIQ